MNKARLNIATSKLVGNSGQLDWLPRNPRTWTAGDLERTKRSIERDGDFLEDRPLLVVPAESGKGERYIVFGGNLRLKACRENGVKTAPAVIYFPETDEDRETVKRRAALDNGSFGSWDYDALANEWDDLPLVDLGIPAWEPEQDWQKNGLSSEGREGDEDYDEFVDKFNEEIPLTTDDCYTPPEVYDAIRDFVDENLTPLKDRKIVRPFYPGGDYEHADYPAGCVVLDNPPFSLYSKIVRFYVSRGIDFFLFGPQLTLSIADADVCFCPFNVTITYENGAKVNTGFVTNLRKDLRIWVESSLRKKVQEIQKTEPTNVVYDFPPEVITSATLGKIANGGDLEIRADECRYIHDLDGMKDIGKGLFGGGFLLSSAAAEKARAAAEKARAVPVRLSEREREIVNALDRAAQP